MSKGKAKFKVAAIAGKNKCSSNQICKLRPQDHVCWVNPTPKAYTVTFGTGILVGAKKSFEVKPGKASRWYHIKQRGWKPKDIFKYRLATKEEGSGGPGGPSIITEGG